MDLTALTLSVALGYSQYTDEQGPEPEPHFRISVGHEDKPYYLWGQWEDLTVRMLGQGVADADIYSFGAGARKSYGDFFGFFEIGYGLVNEHPNSTIQQEIVYTELVLRHNVEFRPIPVYPQGNYDQDSYETVWELDDGLLGEVGVGYQHSDNLSFTASYRPFYVREHIELYDAEQRANGGGWWQESRSRDLSSFQLRVQWEF